MKILALRGENLASIQHRFEIDFASGVLANSGLFAITGKTGSGKSTLLDAICLALYDRMPRLNPSKQLDAEIGLDDETKIKANDVRGILSRGKVQSFAEVDFFATDGTKWRAHWTVRRARGKTNGKIQPSEQWLENLANNQRFAAKKLETLNEIERLVGLTYEQFRRAVMLPQGDFAAFLKAGSDEKAVLLERMTGGEIYALLSKSAFEKAKLEKAQLVKLKEKRSDIAILSDEEQAVLQQELTNATAQRECLLTKKNDLKRFLDILQDRKIQEDSLQNAKKELEQAQMAVQKASNEREQFTLVEKVQPARDEFKQRQEVQGALNELANKLTTQNQELISLNDSIATAIAFGKEAEDWLKQKQEIWQTAKPKLRQAAEKDIEIKGLAKQLADIEKAVSAGEGKIKTETAKLTQAQEKKQQLMQEQEEIKEKLVEKQGVINIAQQFSSVQDNLKQYAKLEKSLKQTHKNIEQLEKKLPLLEKSTKKNNDQLQKIEQEQQQLELELQQIDVTEKEKQQQKLQKENKVLRDQQEQLRKLKDFASEWLNLLKEQQQRVSEQDSLAETLKTAEQEIENTNAQLLQLANKLAEAKLNLEQSRAVASLSEYRNQLKDQSPCPLCGSVEHPYAKSHPVVQGIIASQNKRIEALQNEQQSLASLSALSLQQKKEGAVKKEQLLRVLNKVNHELEEKRADFSALLIECDEVPSSIIELNVEHFFGWLTKTKEKISINTENINLASTTLEDLDKTLKQAYANQKKLVAINQNIAEHNREIQQIESDKALIKADIINHKAQQKKENTTLAERKLLLNKIYASDIWQARLQEIGEQAYLDELKLNISQVTNLQTKEKEKAQELNECDPNIATFEQALASLQSMLQADIKSANSLKAELEAKQQDRQQIFAQQDLEQYEKESKKAIENAQKNNNSAQEKLTSLNDKRIEKQATIDGLTQQQQNAQSKHVELKEKWQHWLQYFDLAENRLTELLNFDSQWLKTQRETLQALDKAVERSETLVKERQQRLDDRQDLFTQAQNWLIEHQADTKQKADELEQKLSNDEKAQEVIIRQRLTSLEISEKAQKQQSELQKQIEVKEQEADVWLKINDFIGASDGKKFRNMAQALTLNQLVGRANQHLHELAPRYALQTVPSSPLALQVVDHDMGDEVRSVGSLSGGESFLVSLSLALALASLAANTKKLGSLFIDEGFGTLDPESLEVTLACLDALQADGRQIGVISHVSTLVERIGTQVLVETKGAGMSRVSIR